MSDIVLTAVLGDGERWALLPASFTKEELQPYRHIFAHFGISELEPKTPVKFYSRMTKERVLTALNEALRTYSEGTTEAQ